MKRSCLLLLFAVTLATSPLFAQEDIEGAREITYFSRLPGFFIRESTTKEFDSYQFYDGKKILAVEGRFHQNSYVRAEEAGPVVSLLQIRRNFLNAIRSAGGTLLFEGQVEEFDDTRSASTMIWCRFTKEGKEVWVEVWPYADNEYYLTVVEKEAMRQDVTAADILAALNKDGHVALYILFETGKSTIQPESRKTVDEIVATLQQDTALRLSIEGHTDSVGSAAANKTLSEARAKAVLDALVAAGIDAKRLTSMGWGREKPIADNATEEGRARNRRVELVKK